MSHASGSSLNYIVVWSVGIDFGMRRGGVAYLVQSGLGGFLLWRRAWSANPQLAAV